MRSVPLRVELLSEAIFRPTSATLGAPPSRGVVPGGALLGAAAKELYRDGVDVWTLFHSGKVRFRDGLPLGPNGTPGVAVPLIWSVSRPPRGGIHVEDATSPHVLQPKSPPNGEFVTEAGCLFRPQHRTSWRTEMMPDGRVAAGHFFRLDALAAGTCFHTCVDLDEDVPVELEQQLVDVLIRCEHRLGAARSSEFGRAKITAGTAWKPAVREARGGRVRLLALSDLALRDPKTGMPTLVPHPGLFGVEGDWLPERSAIRTRTWSPFHAWRGRPDLERQVIAAGSVITFKPSAPQPGLAARLARGVGGYRADGLGQVLVEPALLDLEQLHPPEAWTEEEEGEPDDAELLGWLSTRSEARVTRDDAFDLAREWAQRLRRWPPLPSSQWGELRRAANAARSLEELEQRLFAEPDGLLRAGVGKLKERWGARRDGVTRAEKLASLMRNDEYPSAVRLRAVAVLGMLMVRAQRLSALEGG
jgi:CRISPR-associated protein Csx10